MMLMGKEAAVVLKEKGAKEWIMREYDWQLFEKLMAEGSINAAALLAEGSINVAALSAGGSINAAALLAEGSINATALNAEGYKPPKRNALCTQKSAKKICKVLRLHYGQKAE